MKENTLTSVFSQSEESLREELKMKYLPRDYAEIQKTVNQHIYTLLAGDNAFNLSLNASDAEMLNAALRMALSFQQLSLAETIDFKALSVKTEYEVDNSKTAGGNIDIVKDTISLLPTVICAFINPWLTLAVGGGTILVKRFAKTKNGERQEVLVKEKKTDISHQISDNEIDAIIESIYNICEEIDGIIAKIQRDRADILAQMQYKVDNCTIDHMYPQILTSIQYLAKEQLESETENPNINNLIFSLQGYGYEVVEYNPSTAGFFIKKVNPNVTEESMYLPAIIKDVKGTKVVASEGIVFIPAAVQ